MRISLAYHEGAHCAAIELLDHLVTHADIIPTPQRGGIVHWEARPSEPLDELPSKKLRRQMRASGIISLAGGIAQARVSGQPLRECLSDSDLKQARDAATVIAFTLPNWTPRARVWVFHKLLDEAEALVSENWSMITALAEALQHSKALTGAQVARLVYFANNKRKGQAENAQSDQCLVQQLR
jgi:hypothetical protein